MNLFDFNCEYCIYNRKNRCCEDKEYKDTPKFGCSKGEWIVKMLKWKGDLKDKEPPFYRVGWGWIAWAIAKKDKFMLVKDITNEKNT